MIRGDVQFVRKNIEEGDVEKGSAGEGTQNLVNHSTVSTLGQQFLHSDDQKHAERRCDGEEKTRRIGQPFAREIHQFQSNAEGNDGLVNNDREKQFEERRCTLGGSQCDAFKDRMNNQRENQHEVPRDDQTILA